MGDISSYFLWDQAFGCGDKIHILHTMFDWMASPSANSSLHEFQSYVILFDFSLVYCLCTKGSSHFSFFG